jgi:branched-chain amino acid transport system substrate-binding protein
MAQRRWLRIGAPLLVLGLVAAACGGDDDDSSSATTEAAAAETTAAAAETTAAGGTETTAAGGDTGGAKPCGNADTSDLATSGTGADQMLAALTCAKEKPLKATGDPIVIGLQNPKGDPAGTFPEYETSAKAAVDFINNELGGLGGDFAAGKPGRPIKLEVCSMAINPADSQKCANELAAKKPLAVYSTLNFFGNHFPIYAQAKVPVLVGTPITPGDFTSPGVYAIGNGGGCLGVHTGLIDFTVNELKKKKIAVPWADTPPGVFCYNDLEKKPLNVINGTAKSTSKAAGTVKDLTHIGVPIKPGQADVTPQATQVLDFKPDAIIFSAQGADCWTLVSSLGKLGWDPKTTPLVLSGACIDFKAMADAGDLAKGVYFIGSASNLLRPVDQQKGLSKVETEVYTEKMKQYGAGDDTTKGFATQGFSGMMFMWHLAQAASGGDPAKLTGDAFVAEVGKTDNFHSFGGTPTSCAKAFAPYVAVCNSVAGASQWDGSALVPVKGREAYSGLYLIEGTELDFGS